MSDEQPTMANEQPAQPAPVAAPVEQSTTINLQDLLPEDLRSEGSLASFKDVASLAKSYVHAQKMISTSIRIPGEDAGPEQKAEFYSKLEKVPGIMREPDHDDMGSIEQVWNKLGRPQSPDKYVVNTPEGLDVNHDRLNTFLQEAHKAGLTQQQVAKLVEFEASHQKQIEEMTVQKAEQTKEALKQMWGMDFENRLAGANLTLRTLAEQFPGEIEELTNSPAIANTALLHILSEYAKTIPEDNSVRGEGGSKVSYGMTALEAQDKLKEIFANKSHPYFKAHHPQHKEAVAKVTNLYRTIYPD